MGTGRPARHPPHLVSGLHPPLRDRPVRVLIEIARRLDIHPADLVPELDPLLTCHRQPPGDTGGQDRRADALTVLTALTAARAPLTADQLARALGWQLPRATTWFQHSRTRRTEQDLHGELYVTQFGRRKKNLSACVVRR